MVVLAAALVEGDVVDHGEDGDKGVRRELAAGVHLANALAEGSHALGHFLASVLLLLALARLADHPLVGHRLAARLAALARSTARLALPRSSQVLNVVVHRLQSRGTRRGGLLGVLDGLLGGLLGLGLAHVCDAPRDS